MVAIGVRGKRPPAMIVKPRRVNRGFAHRDLLVRRGNTLVYTCCVFAWPLARPPYIDMMTPPRLSDGDISHQDCCEPPVSGYRCFD